MNLCLHLSPRSFVTDISLPSHEMSTHTERRGSGHARRILTSHLPFLHLPFIHSSSARLATDLQGRYLIHEGNELWRSNSPKVKTLMRSRDGFGPCSGPCSFYFSYSFPSHGPIMWASPPQNHLFVEQIFVERL